MPIATLEHTAESLMLHTRHGSLHYGARTMHMKHPITASWVIEFFGDFEKEVF